ncbi:hypothetical protein GF386_04350 [Candidatus Pacearchaeota archaeon]|nr:hypothetical protein [Candidatus Pacearchaeota archaeon]
MNPKKLTKKQILEEINNIFSKFPSPREIKKAKKLAMTKNIKLGKLRKRFCKKCYSLFPENSEVKIRNNMKIIKCKNCGYVGRYRIK